jgi:two-component system response regulator YesN
MYSVLIVDDEEIIRNGIAQVIDWNKAGYKLIGTAEHGIDALHKITTYLPDIVITDLKMPVMDGISLIKEVRKLEVSTEFIILSGYSEFEYAKIAMEYGIRYYLLKPTNDNTILQTLNQVREEIQKKQATNVLSFSNCIITTSFLDTCFNFICCLDP